jgi:hypothetical protein
MNDSFGDKPKLSSFDELESTRSNDNEPKLLMDALEGDNE